MVLRRAIMASALLALVSGCGSREKPRAEIALPESTTAPAPPPAAPTPTPSADTARPAPPAPAPAPAPKPKPKPPAPAAAAKPDSGQTAPVAAAPAADPWHPAARDTLDMDTYQGWKQYELNCSRCHGEYAVGTSFAPGLAVSLKEGGTIPTREAFITTVCAGRPDKGMPGWCALGLEMDKIQNIYLYVKGRADGNFAIGRPALREQP